MALGPTTPRTYEKVGPNTTQPEEASKRTSWKMLTPQSKMGHPSHALTGLRASQLKSGVKSHGRTTSKAPTSRAESAMSGYGIADLSESRNQPAAALKNRVINPVELVIYLVVQIEEVGSS